MKKRSRILICGNYGATNLGDEAILQSILQCVASVFPEAHVQVVSANPELTAKQYGIQTVSKIPAGFRSMFKGIFSKRLMETLREYQYADAVIFGGGGLFSDENLRRFLSG
jgi:polysaccharide pyruvyl transferase WcaK-like protein